MYCGYPDHDYELEAAENEAYFFAYGMLDKCNGHAPNPYLYSYASPNYSCARGYRAGYDYANRFPGRVTMTYQQKKFIQRQVLDYLLHDINPATSSDCSM